MPYNCVVIHLQDCAWLNSLLYRLPDKLFPQNPAEFYEKMTQIIINMQSCDTISRFKTTSLLFSLLNDLINAMPDQADLHMGYNPHINKAIKYIYENLDSPINIEQLAHKCDLSKSYFHKAFKESTGLTPNNFILNLKINRCKQLLHLTGMSIGEIAESVGFYDCVYFSYVFKRITKMSPSQYRKKMRD